MAENRHLATRNEVGRKHGVAEEPKQVRKVVGGIGGKQKKKKKKGREQVHTQNNTTNRRNRMQKFSNK